MIRVEVSQDKLVQAMQILKQTDPQVIYNVDQLKMANDAICNLKDKMNSAHRLLTDGMDEAEYGERK